ncbi:MAG TPA: dipeptide epimerase [Acidobacteriota bacterium]|nr:dipeptide epimerase [Acidobacteriota bacterium]
MIIKKLSAWIVEMPLDEPYEVAYQSFDTAVNVMLRLETDRGIEGSGCAAPDPNVTGETPQGVLEALQDTVASQISGQDALRPARLLHRIVPSIRDQRSARAALDMALWDLMGKAAGLPLWRLLGGYRQSIRTSITIGILDKRETLQRARCWRSQGFTSLKLKGGKDVESDIARVLAVRRELGDEVELRFDANQGYGVEEALHFVGAVRPARVEILEQPTPKAHPHLLGEVSRGAPSMPVMADESLINHRDAFRLARRGQADMVNIKLQKAGGISEALHIDSVARSARLESMVGCMDESALGIAAGLAFALARPNVHYADLDGHIGLQNDPFPNCLTLSNGVLYPSPHSGLGTAS